MKASISYILIAVALFSGVMLGFFGRESVSQSNTVAKKTSPVNKAEKKEGGYPSPPVGFEKIFEDPGQEKLRRSVDRIRKDPILGDFFESQGIGDQKARAFQAALLESSREMGKLFIDEETGTPVVPSSEERVAADRRREEALVKIVGEGGYQAYRQFTQTLPFRMGFEIARSNGLTVPERGTVNRALAQAQSEISSQEFKSPMEYSEALSERVMSVLSDEGSGVGDDVSAVIREAIEGPMIRKAGRDFIDK